MLSKRSRDFRALTCDMTGDWTMVHGRLVGSMHGSWAFFGFRSQAATTDRRRAWGHLIDLLELSIRKAGQFTGNKPEKLLKFWFLYSSHQPIDRGSHRLFSPFLWPCTTRPQSVASPSPSNTLPSPFRSSSPGPRVSR